MTEPDDVEPDDVEPDDTEPDDDPFAGVTFDEAWIAASAAVEPSARLRANRVAFDQRDALEAEEARSRAVRARRRRRLRRIAMVVLVAILAPVVVNLLRRDPGSDATGRLSGRPIQLSASPGDVPPAVAAESNEPLGVAPSAPDDDRYEFMATRPGGQPVTWDPCRPIQVVVDERTAPDDATALLDDALGQISKATGLQFEVEGTTDEEPTIDRDPYQRDRYGERWAPVLVAWTDPEEVPDLADEVAGIGGPISINRGGGPSWWVSGIVLLDGPQIEEIRDRRSERDAVAVVVHELGHLVGLGHVDVPSQLMYREGNDDNGKLGDGDRAGLARLGGDTCAGPL